MKLPTSFKTKKQRINFAREFLNLYDLSDEEIIQTYNIFPPKQEKETVNLPILGENHLFWLEFVFNRVYPQIDTVEYFKSLNKKWYVAKENYIRG